MAKKKRKVRYDRIIILILGCALIIGAVFIGVSCITGEIKPQTSDQPGSRLHLCHHMLCIRWEGSSFSNE